MHARLAAQRMQAPLFLVQSSLDAWQLANIWRGATLTNGAIDAGSCIGSLYEAPCHTNPNPNPNPNPNSNPNPEPSP